MRDRLPADWKTDLKERHQLEADVRNELAAHPELAMLQCSTASTDRLDYQLVGPGARLCEVELKTKRQVYRGWTRYRPDASSWRQASTPSCWSGTCPATAGRSGRPTTW
jgi:hypothetical protein